MSSYTLPHHGTLVAAPGRLKGGAYAHISMLVARARTVVSHNALLYRLRLRHSELIVRSVHLHWHHGIQLHRTTDRVRVLGRWTRSRQMLGLRRVNSGGGGWARSNGRLLTLHLLQRLQL
jgi:hypothetical protein